MRSHGKATWIEAVDQAEIDFYLSCSS